MPNKNLRSIQQPIVKVDSRKASKFGNRGSVGDDGGRCHEHTGAVGDSVQKSQPAGGNHGGDDRDVDEWGGRRESSRSRKKVSNIDARSLRFNKNVECILVPDSPESAQEEHSPEFDGANRGLWVNWKLEPVDSRQIGWKQGVLNSQPDGGSPIDAQDVYLIAPVGKLPRDIAKEEIQEFWQDVSKANVKEIVGLYDLGCFNRWPRRRSNNIIDARWVITWKVIEGSVGVKCRLVVRGFKDKFPHLDICWNNRQVRTTPRQRRCSRNRGFRVA